MFFEHANEERQHGLKFIEYLRMRGNLDSDFFSSIHPVLGKTSWQDGEEALRDALEMEKKVSMQIKKLIDACEGGDYHAADWLTGVWLEEQLAGQRDLAGKINTFASFRRDHEALADWMFSQHLLQTAA